MRYAKFGSTDMVVSEIALGTWGIGGAGWDDNSEDTRLDAIRSAVESGINFIDTAPAYKGGVAESYVGKVISSMGIRKELYLVTKCGTEFIDGKYVRSCAGSTILRECENSLRNLQTDYIDLYMIHWPDASVPLEETMDALKTLKQQGKILHVGVSNFNRQQMEEANRFCPIEAYQPQYSMVFQGNEPQMRWAAEQGMGVMTYGSLGAGILTGAYRKRPKFPPTDTRSRFYKHFREPAFSRIMKLVELMDIISDAHGGIPLAQIAINWAVQKEFVTSSIVGVQHRERVLQNCDSFDWSLTPEEISILDSAIKYYLKRKRQTEAAP